MSAISRAAVAALAMSLALTCATPAMARGPATAISTVQVHSVDLVDAIHNQECGVGSPTFALRKGADVWYFSSAANEQAYAKHPEEYPDAFGSHLLAFFGGDIVERYPYGVHADDLGPAIAGDLAHAVTYRGATFVFSSEATREAFAADPERWMLPVGGHCILAMASGHIVPGDPRYTRWYAARQTWVVFGSAKGPVAWDRMSGAEHQENWAAADENFVRLFSPAPLATNGTGLYRGEVARTPVKEAVASP